MACNAGGMIVARSEHVVSRMVDGEAVIVEPQKGLVNVVTTVGSRIWELVDGARTAADIADMIATEWYRKGNIPMTINMGVPPACTLMAGGGLASNYDPLDVTQYTVAELRAAVEAAENWGTYVTVHAYTPRAVRQAIHSLRIGVSRMRRSRTR